MIVCPNCNHPNPEGAQACEACYTPLPATTSCPNCGTPVQTDSRFCGQCGFDLDSSTAADPTIGSELPSTVPNLVTPSPLQPAPLESSLSPAISTPVTEVT